MHLQQFHFEPEGHPLLFAHEHGIRIIVIHVEGSKVKETKIYNGSSTKKREKEILKHMFVKPHIQVVLNHQKRVRILQQYICFGIRKTTIIFFYF